MNNEKEDKISKEIIQIANNYLSKQNNIFDKIDSKVMRMFGFISLTQGYLVTQFFIRMEYGYLTIQNGLLLMSVIVGVLTLYQCLNTLSGKPFNLGSNPVALTKKMRKDKDRVDTLYHEHLSGMNEASNQNDQVLKEKSNKFKNITIRLMKYYVLIILFFISISNVF